MLLFSTDLYAQKTKRDSLKKEIEKRTKAIAGGPQDSFYRYNYSARASAKYDLKDYKGAIEDYTKSMELDSTNMYDFYLIDYYFRGLCKAKLKNYKGAIEDYTKSLTNKWYDYSTYFFIGELKSRLKDYKGAIEAYSQSIKLHPTIHVYEVKATIEKKLGYINEACADLKKAAELGGDFKKEIKKCCPK